MPVLWAGIAVDLSMKTGDLAAPGRFTTMRGEQYLQ